MWTRRALSCLFFASLFASTEFAFSAEPVWPDRRWKILFPTSAAATTLTPLTEYKIDGPYEDSTLFLSKFVVDSSWDVKDRMLQVPNGTNAALKLGRAENFVLEGQIDLTGPGGMFIVLGENQGHGYGLCSTTMLKSGSPWKLFEFRGNEAIEGTDEEVGKYEPLRPGPMQLRVEDHKVSLTIGKIMVFENVPMENYHEGDVTIGVFDTKYGPRKVKIQSLRARSIPSD